ncbi:MAG: anthranilate synthase component I [Sedimentisphaerales bacterium]|nr:anthranilate synthase component I [Sedimentisphaerales bacterium]
MKDTFITKGGIRVIREKVEVSLEEALGHIYADIDRAKGAIFASDYEYPGRYSRWDIGFIDPPLEMTSQGRNFTFRALNERGRIVLRMWRAAIEQHPHVECCHVDEESITGVIRLMPDYFPEEQRSKQPSIFSLLRALCNLMACDDEYLTMFGAFGYDLVFQFEPITFKLDRSHTGPDCHLFLADRVSAIDHQRGNAFNLFYEFENEYGSTIGLPVEGMRRELKQYPSSPDIDCDHAPGEYADKVEQIRQGCKRGDFFEVVLSQSFRVHCGDKPGELFEYLRRHNPSPYDFLINLGDEQLIGASPEIYVRVDGKDVETCPISGTVRRGDDAMQDAAQILKLLSSKKDESELTMCTDVDRNDKSRVCVPGSVQLIGRRLIESYSRLFHTVDHVKGVLREDCDLFDALLTHMWTCTLTGAPKPIAMQTIENLEKDPRRWYAACIGFFTFGGQLNTGTTIRTIFLQDGIATVRAGATLLYDSVPDEEEKETRLKASAFLGAVTASKGVKEKSPAPRVKHRKAKKLLFVDNQDSFVHTLANYVRQTGVEVVTLRCGFNPKHLDEIRPDLLFISPGPKTPRELGVLELIEEGMKRNLPMFGVCLGHQGLGEYFGAELGVLDAPMHGKESLVHHNQKGIFQNIPTPFPGGRYHSLYIIPDTVPDCLEVTARSDDDVIMAIRHRELPIAAVQFHPESILTLQDDIGIKLISNVVETLM